MDPRKLEHFLAVIEHGQFNLAAAATGVSQQAVSKAIAKPAPDQTWLLVASAQDMPRTVGIFRKLNWPVTAVPVAYKSDSPHSYSLGSNLHAMDRAVHEWLGLLIYRVTGKTDSLFPAPRQ